MSSKKQRVAKVKIAGRKDVVLPVSSLDKPSISPAVMNKWQSIVNLAAKAIDVPAGLIMHLEPGHIEVALTSITDGNPYKPLESEELGIGLYCETVVATRQTLHIPNALEDEVWKDNPDIKLNMISYLGMPLKWPDGEIFGTICVLDSKEHKYSETHIELLAHFRLAVETDLYMLMEREELRRLNVEKELSIKEAHHRIKNHLNMLTGVLQLSNHKKPMTEESFSELVKDITNRIRSIAELHSQMSLARESSVDLGLFLEKIARTIIKGIAGKKVALTFKADDITVGREIFFHTGLLVSELVTNAIKHAFAEVNRPRVTIHVEDTSEGIFTLKVSDNGPGLPKGFDPATQESIGMMLIADLPGHMDGSYTLTNDGGAVYEFNLKKQLDEI